MNRHISLLLVIALLSLTACLDHNPDPSCIKPDVFKVPSFATVIANQAVTSEEDSGTYWVCNGGQLTLTGTDNLILVDSGGILIIDGIQNEAFNLDGGKITLNGGDNEVWLNGASKTYVYGFENQLYYYRVAQVFEYGDGTYVDDICGNVEVDFSNAPTEGCR